MFIRLPRGSKWKIRVIFTFMACFFGLAVVSKWVYVSKLRQIPYVRVPAFVVTKRSNPIPLGTQIFVDSQRDYLQEAIENVDFLHVEKHGNSSVYHLAELQDLSRRKKKNLDSKQERQNGRAKGVGDILQRTGGKVLNVFIWDEICGDNLQNLLNHPLFTYMPSRRRFSTSFKLPHFGQNLGLFLVGYFTPFCEGYHILKLQIKSGNSEVWISKNQSKQHIELVLWTNGKEAKTKKELYLKKNQKYYFEVLHKEGSSDSKFELDISYYSSKCNKHKQVVTFEPLISPRTIWDGDTVEVHLEPTFLTKRIAVSQNPNEVIVTKRETIYTLPFMDEADIDGIFPKCKYEPSYIVTRHLEKYDGVWETHYSSIYPSDDTNMTDILSSGERQIIFGNDILEKNIAMKMLHGVVGAIKVKHPGKYRLSSVLNVEENIDPNKGRRYLVELELYDTKKNRNVRFSEYVYQQPASGSICFPEGFRWNRTAVVNIILTVGGQGRWAKYFIDAVDAIYKASKDPNINLIIVDFNSQHLDLKKALEASSIPKFMLLNRFGGFYKSEAIQQATNSILEPDSIVLLMDLHLLIPHDFIDVVRKHCVKGRMAFNPILARLNCAANHKEPKGFWENVGYGIFATYKSDWDVFGGMNYAKFKDHWGGEDWEMLDRVLMAKFEVERLKIKNFFHVFHTKKGMWQDFGT